MNVQENQNINSNDIINDNRLITTVGKRKTSVAKVFLKKGTKKIIVNTKEFKIYFANILEQGKKITNCLKLIENYSIEISVHGGGISSQLDAIFLAIAKAICLIDSSHRSFLKKNHFLTRDSRIKERRKYGLKKARKASQYSKR